MDYPLGLGADGRTQIDLWLDEAEKSPFEGGALARARFIVSNLLTMDELRLYRRHRDGMPFVSGVVQNQDSGQKPRSPLRLYGDSQYACTTILRETLKSWSLDEYCDPTEVPLDDEWLFIGHEEFTYSALRSHRTTTIWDEHVYSIRQNPLDLETWTFSIRLGDIVLEHCTAMNLDTSQPSVVAPLATRRRPYATLAPQLVQRIVAALRTFRETKEAV